MDIALGEVYTGVFTNSDSLWSELNTAGEREHDTPERTDARLTGGEVTAEETEGCDGCGFDVCCRLEIHALIVGRRPTGRASRPASYKITGLPTPAVCWSGAIGSAPVL